MALSEGQVQVRDLLMGPSTSYRILTEFNPFMLSVRADQGGPRAWNHGSWSGAEWADERLVPLRIVPKASDDAGWLALHQALAAAFAPVGDVSGPVELRFALGGTEYLLLGRPRLVEPNLSTIGVGWAYTQCVFVAQDPRIYSGDLVVQSTSLPVQRGGLTVPFTLPLLVAGTVDGGRVELLNEGTADAPLLVRIDGPVPQPRIVLQRPDGTVQQVRLGLDLPTGQWVEVDTAAGTVFLNGLPTASVRGQAAWDIDSYPLQPGVNVLRFGAADFVEDALVTATNRSAWW
jgi:hypothetical protein